MCPEKNITLTVLEAVYVNYPATDEQRFTGRSGLFAGVIDKNDQSLLIALIEAMRRVRLGGQNESVLTVPISVESDFVSQILVRDGPQIGKSPNGMTRSVVRKTILLGVTHCEYYSGSRLLFSNFLVVDPDFRAKNTY